MVNVSRPVSVQTRGGYENGGGAAPGIWRGAALPGGAADRPALSGRNHTHWGSMTFQSSSLQRGSLPHWTDKKTEVKRRFLKPAGRAQGDMPIPWGGYKVTVQRAGFRAGLFHPLRN